MEARTEQSVSITSLSPRSRRLILYEYLCERYLDSISNKTFFWVGIVILGTSGGCAAAINAFQESPSIGKAVIVFFILFVLCFWVVLLLFYSVIAAGTRLYVSQFISDDDVVRRLQSDPGRKIESLIKSHLNQLDQAKTAAQQSVSQTYAKRESDSRGPVTTQRTAKLWKAIQLFGVLGFFLTLLVGILMLVGPVVVSETALFSHVSELMDSQADFGTHYILTAIGISIGGPIVSIVIFFIGVIGGWWNHG